MASVEQEYLIHKETGRIIVKGAKAYPKGTLLPYTPPKYLRKMDGPNKGSLFPWTFLMSQRRDMVAFNGDPDNLPALPEVAKTGPGVRPQPKAEAKAGEMTDEELLDSNDLHPVPVDEPEHIEPAAPEAGSDEAEGILDKLCIQNGTTREQEIINAIGRLDTKDFGGKGAPKMEAMYRELDDTVGYQEMQAAWKIIKEGKK